MTGHGWDLTLINGAFASKGVLMLNGNSQYAEFPSGLLLGLNAYTISCWVNISAIAYWARIWDFGRGQNNHIIFAESETTTGVPTFQARINGGKEQRISTSMVHPLNKWIHMAVSFDGAKVSIFINGKEDVSGPCSFKPADLGVTTQNWLGKSWWSADGYFTGSIADFRIYESALTADEVMKMYSQGVGF